MTATRHVLEPKLGMSRVLVADDDLGAAEATASVIRSAYGTDVAVAGSLDSTLDVIGGAHHPFDLVIVDINFKDKGGEKAGIQIAEAAKKRSSQTQILIVTGYSRELDYSDMLRLADVGVRTSAWICKGSPQEITDLLLAVKRSIERKHEVDFPAKVYADVKDLWRRSTTTKDRKQRGDLLEAFSDGLFSLVPGLTVVQRNRRLTGEEIDLILENSIPSPFWSAFSSPYILVECKNYVRNVEAAKIREFAGKLRHHRNLSRIGLLISSSGFSRGAREAQRMEGLGELVISLISGNDIDTLFDGSDDVEEWLRQRVLSSIC